MAVSLASAAWGQVESHMLSKQFPDWLLPAQVSGAPCYAEREIAAEPPAGRSNANAPAAGPSATAMPDDAREVIRLAEGRQWAQAAEAGQTVLRKPLTELTDYAWDYVANATAWALIQTGRVDEAAGAHTAAAARFRDNDMRVAHRLIAAALQQTEKKASQLQKADVYRDEIRESVADRIQKVKDFTNAAKESTSGNTLVFRLSQAYGELRVLGFVDPDMGKQLIENHFKPAADALVTMIIPIEIRKGEAIVDTLETQWGDLLPASEFGKWNATVNALWSQVAGIKRLGRIHHHLASLDLAGSRDAAKLFRQAHDLLFVPGTKGLVWQSIGETRVINGIGQKDMRRRAPWKETDIAPIGVAATGRPGESSTGWKRMENTDGGRRK